MNTGTGAKPLDMEAVHAVELDMLKAVADLCERKGIRYWLYCGTLLGAVRHGGFIPWDDDIDLAMPLKDYRRFLRAADELPDDLECSHLNNTHDHFLLWAKISAKGTTAMPAASAALNIPWGIYIDIYPMIGAFGQGKKLRFQRLLLDTARRLRSADNYRVLREPGIGKKILGMIPFFIRKGISDLMLRFAMRDPEKSQWVGTLDAADFEGKYARQDWAETTMLQFGDRKFPAPVQYDRLLTRMYGDYMKLPPEDKRTPHLDRNGEMIIDPYRDYHSYQKELLEK